jgi:hypothetical protein
MGRGPWPLLPPPPSSVSAPSKAGRSACLPLTVRDPLSFQLEILWDNDLNLNLLGSQLMIILNTTESIITLVKMSWTKIVPHQDQDVHFWAYVSELILHFAYQSSSISHSHIQILPSLNLISRPRMKFKFTDYRNLKFHPSWVWSWAINLDLFLMTSNIITLGPQSQISNLILNVIS